MQENGQEDTEVLALLLPGSVASEGAFDPGSTRAQRLVRRGNGRVALEPVSSREDLLRTAQRTGCFRRGRPIVDPDTREVIGYEMEEVPARTLSLA